MHVSQITASRAAAIFLPALIFYALGQYVLLNGHPHEDAFILFIFSEQLATTGRISYYSGGPPTEGATDFLWMVAIAALNFVGIASGQAALLLNAAGIGLLAGLVYSGIVFYRGSLLLAFLFALSLPFQGFILAGYGGFSTPLFAALTALIFATVVHARGATLVLVPVLSIILGLFRPDGVVLGICFTLVGLFICPTEHRRRYLLVAAGTVVVGLLYFLWRWSYFKEFLPLPLMVKSTGDRILNGLWPNISWAQHNAWLIALCAVGLFAFTGKGQRLLLALAPLLVFLVFLSFGVQSQNVAFRFQAPVTACIFLVGAIGFAIMYKRGGDAQIRLLSLSAIFLLVSTAGGFGLRQQIKYLTNDDYINFFPVQLCPHVTPDSSIALTEAGRLAYWMPGRFTDLVGLNTAATASAGATPEFIADLKPDLIFIHTAGTASFQCEGNYCLIEPDVFFAATSAAISTEERRARVIQAPIAVFQHVANQIDRYDILSVRYGDEYSHLYAVARDGQIDTADFVSALDQSFSPEARLSYMDALSAPMCRR